MITYIVIQDNTGRKIYEGSKENCLRIIRTNKNPNLHLKLFKFKVNGDIANNYIDEMCINDLDPFPMSF